MAIEDRRERERSARRRLIMNTARAVAEAEGWDAVTTRRLSTEIEYSQPVLYKHFTGMDEIAEAVAIEGFGELADALRTARVNAATAEQALTLIAHTYLDFARNNPALYDAMFTRTTTMRFAVSDTPLPAQAAFGELHEAVSAVGHGRDHESDHERDTDTFAEVFWAALHGLTALARADRLRPDYDSERVELLVAQFALAP